LATLLAGVLLEIWTGVFRRLPLLADLGVLILLVVFVIASRRARQFASGRALNEGLAWAYSGQYERAEQSFTRVLHLGHPDYAPAALLNLGMVNAAEGRIEAARLLLERAAGTRHPDVAPSAELNLATLLSHVEDPMEVQECFQRLFHASESV